MEKRMREQLQLALLILSSTSNKADLPDNVELAF